MAKETFKFQTEVQKLLELMIHSLYSQKEIFLRELISNSSDATDRIRFEALTKPELIKEDSELRIKIETSQNSRTVTVHDNGIGMSRKEVIENIGTIAKSGTSELVEKVKKAKAGKGAKDVTTLIGQFGVGFYSVFMVAKKVVLITRRAGQKTATIWESEGKGEYRIDKTTRASHGTSITLYLHDIDEEQGLENFTDEHVIGRIVSRYSDFISYPVVLVGEGSEEKTLNSMKPIWERSASDVTDDEYAEFYRHISHVRDAPMETILQRAEGLTEYKALLFIPSEVPFDLYYVGHESGLRLYVKRVSIMERCEDLLPRYLRFIKGVVDTSDLPLNVSRETLQDVRQIRQIRKGLQKKILDTIQKMKGNEQDKYSTFFQRFGRALKEGVVEDLENRERIVDLLLFSTSTDSENMTSLENYVERMGTGQNTIYYMTGDSREAIESSPHLEAFRDQGVEVLILTDAVDELLVQQALTEYRGNPLKSAGKGKLDLGTKEEKENRQKELDQKEKAFEALLEKMKVVLDDRVKEVRLSSRLTTSPACLVSGDEDVSPRLEKMFHPEGDLPARKRILELNAEHLIVSRLKAKFDVQESSEAVAEFAELLYGYASLAEGAEIADPAGLALRLSVLMERSLEN